MSKTLSDDATIETVWPHLAHPREYVAGVRHKMLNCSQQHGNAHVCIGVTGSGQKPCYRVFYKSPAGADIVFGSYWDNHDALAIEDAITNNWSSKSMDFEQVDAFLKDKINWKKKS